MKKDRIHQLYMILVSSNEWFLAEDLAMQLHTTTRTIQNYVNEINNTSPNGQLIVSSFRGYRWAPEPRQKSTSKNNYALMDSMSPEDRYWYILGKIIAEQTDYERLLCDLFISDTTFDSDLQKIRILARQHGVRLRKVKGKLFLNGRKSDIRHLRYLCIIQNSKNRNITFSEIKELFLQYDCSTLYKELERILATYHMTANAYAHSTLFLLIMIQYCALMHGSVMTESESIITDLHAHIEFTVASELASVYEEKTGTRYNKWEVEYLSTVIISMCEFTSKNHSMQFADYRNLKDNTVLNLKDASLALGVSLLDGATIEKMTCYMQRLIIRNKMGFIIRDLTFQSMKAAYPVIQDVSAWILILISKQYGLQIDRNEVGFLAKYLYGLIKDHKYRFDFPVDTTLICPSFGEFPSELVSSLTKHLGESINLNSIIDSYDPDSSYMQSQGLLLSVIPVPEVSHCVYISLYPRAADFRHIYSELHRIKMKIYCEHLANIMEQYLYPEIVICNKPNLNGILVLDDICDTLQKSGYITSGFADDIAEREQMDPSIYHSNIALPHVRSKNVRRNFIQIALFVKPAKWGEANIDLLCIIGIIDGVSQHLYEIYDLCTKVFSDQQNIRILLKAHNRSSFIDILRTIN